MTDETIGPDDGQFGLSYPIPEEHCDEETEAEGTVRQWAIKKSVEDKDTTFTGWQSMV